MSNDFLLVIIISGFAAALTVLGAIVAERTEVPKRTVNRALQFAAGVLIGLVGFTLMPPAMSAGSSVIVVVGFFLGGASFVVLDYVSSQKKHAEPVEIAAVSTALYVGIIVDMLIDGVVIGLGSSLTLGTGMILALSIAISTAPLALVTIAIAKQSGQTGSFRRKLMAVFIAAIMGGALLGFLIFRNQSLEARLFVIAVASGFLITTVTQSIIPEAKQDDEPGLAGLFFVCGLSLYALFSLIG